jgi:TonB-linked SusC/RagA family outer membrane protein
MRKKCTLLGVILLFFGLKPSFLYAIPQTDQTLQVKGKVTNEQRQVLGQVTVRVENGKVRTATNQSGEFSIQSKMGDMLIFSYTGMQTRKMKVSGVYMQVTLQQKNETLDEVVVTGYETIDKRLFTGASQNLKMADIKVDGTTDVSRMLQGRAAGVNVQNVSGTFGSAPKITIRGGSSILGQTSPLWVIDGVVREDIVEQNFNDLTSGNAQTLIGSSLAGINADDIEKIDVLRDAAATSLYGARALNGVIVITTKKGKKQSRLAVNYNSQFTMRPLPSYKHYNMLNSYESMGLLKEELEKGFFSFSSLSNASNSGVLGMAYKRMRTFDTASGQFLLRNTPEDLNRFLQTYEKANTDWFDILFKRSVSQNHTVSFTGGGESNAFYASLGYLHDPGWSVGEQVDQVNLNLKNTFFLSDKVDLGFSLLGSVRDQRSPGTFDSQDDSYYGKVTRDFEINPFGYATSTSRMLRPFDEAGNPEYYTANYAPFNILQELQNNTMKYDVKDVQFQVDFKYKWDDHLDFSSIASARMLNSTNEHRLLENSNSVQAYRAVGSQQIRQSNRFLYTDPTQEAFVPISVLKNGGIYKFAQNNLRSYYFRNSFHYNNRFNEIHDIDALVAQEIRYVDRDGPRFTGYGLQYDRGNVPFTDPRIIEKSVNEGSDYFALLNTRERTVAFLLKATYAYKNRYIVSFASRYDGSNRQGEASDNRWIPTWTASGKWNALEEPFLKSWQGHVLSGLQLRYSYGLTANTGPATNSYAVFNNAVTVNRLRPQDRESVLNIDALRNRELTWEKQYASNLGIDLAFLDNDLTLSTELYLNKAFDLIDYVQVGGIGGELEKSANNADMRTKGLEISLSGNAIRKQDFSWTTSVNFSVYDQKITRINSRARAFDLVKATGGNILGYPRNSLFSFDFQGLDNRGLPQFSIIENGARKTVIQGIDMQNRDQLLDYLIYEGPADPNLTVGLSNTFRYKNWSFSFFLYGSDGNVRRLRSMFASSYAEGFVPTQDFVNRWLLPGDERITNIPVVPDGRLINEMTDLQRAYNGYNNSTVRVASGSYIRVRNVALSYNLPASLLKKLTLQSLSVRLAATNPLLLYSDKKLRGMDPEFFDTGGVAMPIPKQYILSLSVGF